MEPHKAQANTIQMLFNLPLLAGGIVGNLVAGQTSTIRL
jgi:hypothetical protein